MLGIGRLVSINWKWTGGIWTRSWKTQNRESGLRKVKRINKDAADLVGENGGDAFASSGGATMLATSPSANVARCKLVRSL